MKIRQLTDSFRFIIVGILMSTTLLLPQINSTSQPPADSIDSAIERHQMLAAKVFDHLPHSHDSDSLEEASLAHQHGHNSADHTHNSLHLSPLNLLLGLSSNIGSSAYQRRHLAPDPSLWQRPPKSNPLS